MTPEEVEAFIAKRGYRYPTLHAGQTGLHVITLQIWLQMLGFYQGPITGLLDPPTAQAVDAFRAQQLAAGIALQAPTGAVLERDTWEAMDHLLQQRLPPDPTTHERLPFPRRSSYDSDAKYEKALYEGLRAFGFPVTPAQEPLRLPLTIDDSGVAFLHGLPPGDYALELDDAGDPDLGGVKIYLQDETGAPFSGQIRLIRDGAQQLATVVSGQVLISGLEPGDYQITVEKVDEANQIIDNTGSLEVQLVDAAGLPTSGTAFLVGETGDVASLRQAARLFQALCHEVTRGLEPDDKSRLGTNILTGNFAETAHGHHELVWENFEHTWGRFYGAPWMGVMFHPMDRGEAGREQEELNWGERETIAMLYEWGNAYLQASHNEAELEDRLRRPVAIRYIARPLGGRVDGRADFSQIGTAASLHLPRELEQLIGGIATGKTYGGVDYDSPDYSAVHLETQLSAFASLSMSSVGLCPDPILVRRFPRLFAEVVVADLNPRSRSINAKAENLSRMKTRALLKIIDHTIGPERAQQLSENVILHYVPANEAAVRTWIDTLTDGSEQAYAELELRRLAKKGKSLYMQEQYELLSRPLSVTTVITQPYAPDDIFGSTSNRRKGFYYTTIRIASIVPGKVLVNTDQASKISPSMINEYHYSLEDDTKHKVDLHTKYNPSLVWFGPVFPFRVVSIDILTPEKEAADRSLNAYDDLRFHGSRIIVEVLPDRPIAPDTKPLEPQKLLLAHFTVINQAIYEAGIQPREKPFDPGTFLGMTKRFIGDMTGPHLHISSQDKNYPREKIYTLWTGNPPPRKKRK